MKYIRFINKDDKTVYGIIENGIVCEVDRPPYIDGWIKTGDEYAYEGVTVLSPSDPDNIFCIGTNYMDHIRESKEKLNVDLPIPDHPLLFSKCRNALAGPEDEIEYPTPVERVDYEGELCVVIGKPCRKVSKEEALDYVAGYTCANDISARDFQFADGQWLRGKSLDKFCPFGPVVTDEIDSFNTKIQVRVNGETVQTGTTSDMIFDVPSLLAYISEWITLMPGDIILTGTPEGVGNLYVGDTVEVDIDGIGILRNTMVKAK